MLSSHPTHPTACSFSYLLIEPCFSETTIFQRLLPATSDQHNQIHQQHVDARRTPSRPLCGGPANPDVPAGVNVRPCYPAYANSPPLGLHSVRDNVCDYFLSSVGCRTSLRAKVAYVENGVDLVRPATKNHESTRFTSCMCRRTRCVKPCFLLGSTLHS